MSDKRREPRLEIRLEVELHTGDEACSLHTRDLSNRGLFLEKGESHLPQVGSIVHVRVKQEFADGEPPMVKAEVVRSDEHGIALKFLET